MTETMNPRTIKVQKFSEPGWELHVIEGMPIQRVFWVNFEAGHVRTGHATRVCEQIAFVQKGEVQLTTEANGITKKFVLKSTGRALYIPAMAWRSYKALSREATMLVICSKMYDETDYIRNYEAYKDEIRQS